MPDSLRQGTSELLTVIEQEWNVLIQVANRLTIEKALENKTSEAS